MSIADELEKLANLRDSGVLTEGEFNGQKAKIIGKEEPFMFKKTAKQKNEAQETFQNNNVNTKTLKESTDKNSASVAFLELFIFLGGCYYFLYSGSLPPIDVSPEVEIIVAIKDCEYESWFSKDIHCTLTEKVGYQIRNYSLKAVGYNKKGNKIAGDPFPSQGIGPGESYRGSVLFYIGKENIDKIVISYN